MQALGHRSSVLVERRELKNKTNDETEPKPRFFREPNDKTEI